jgi:hypothetical protein
MKIKITLPYTGIIISMYGKMRNGVSLTTIFNTKLVVIIFLTGA